jgi:hypothetical protein
MFIIYKWLKQTISIYVDSKLVELLMGLLRTEDVREYESR